MKMLLFYTITEHSATKPRTDSLYQFQKWSEASVCYRQPSQILYIWRKTIFYFTDEGKKPKKSSRRLR